MKNFKTLETFRTQGEEAAQKRAKYAAKVEEAKAALADVSKSLDEVVHAEVASGTDKTSEKTAARKKIASAELAVKHTEEEQQTAHAYLNAQPAGSLTPADVVQAYLNEYKPAVQAEHFPDIQTRILQGQALILQALYDYKRLHREYVPVVNEVKSLNEAAHRNGGVSYSIGNPFELLIDSGFSPNEFQQALVQVDSGGEVPAKFVIKEEK